MICGIDDPTCNTDGSTDEQEKVAENIANALKKENFDVIALNEAWAEDEKGKQTLVDKLGGNPYPFWVKYADVFGGGFEEDSGLMLFSKFPFEPLSYPNASKRDNRTSYGKDSPRVLFEKFPDCSSEGFFKFKDCKASKGVMYVRLRHTGNNRLIHLLPTHTQASYSGSDKEEDTKVRCKQFSMVTPVDCVKGPYFSTSGEPSYSWGTYDAISRFVNPLPYPETLLNYTNTQWILALGDFNIDGAGAVSDELFPSGTNKKKVATGPPEYANTIGALLHGVPEFPIYDAWSTTTSEYDKGLTTADERLDHILVSRRTQQNAKGEDLCIQHIWNPPALEALSDHRAVAADINLYSLQCNPRLAFAVPEASMGATVVGTTKVAESFTRQISHPGGMQWWRLDQPGTYSIAFESTFDAQYELYEGGDLSHPLRGDFKLEKTTLTKCVNYGTAANPAYDDCEKRVSQAYVLPVGPIYVRVFFPDRDATGDYSIAFYRHGCSSAEDFCELLPNASYAFRFPTAVPLNANDTAWFRFQIREKFHNYPDVAYEDTTQNLRFVAGLLPTQANPGVDLFVTNKQGVPLTQFGVNFEAESSYSWPSHPDLIATALRSKEISGPSPFLRVHRKNQVLQGITARVTWQTDLTLVGGSSVGATKAWLKCDDETGLAGLGGEIGSDHIGLFFSFDNGHVESRGDGYFNCNGGSSPVDWNNKLGTFPVRLDVGIHLFEFDTPSANDSLGYARLGNPGVDDLSMDLDLVVVGKGKSYFEKTQNFTGNDGHYKLHLNWGKWRRQ